MIINLPISNTRFQMLHINKLYTIIYPSKALTYQMRLFLANYNTKVPKSVLNLQMIRLESSTTVFVLADLEIMYQNLLYLFVFPNERIVSSFIEL